MRLLRLATLVVALLGGSIGVLSGPASATPLSGATSASVAGPLSDNPLLEKSHWRPYYHRHRWRHWRRHHWRPYYYHPRRHHWGYWRPWHHRHHHWRRHYWY